MNCDIGEDLRCRRCGAVVSGQHVKRNCRPGLGDFVAMGLGAFGVTKHLVERVIGGPCGCDERRELFNEWGQAIGIGCPDAAEAP